TPEALATLPVFPLKNGVLFPHLFLPLSAGRPASVAAVDTAMAGEKKGPPVVPQPHAPPEKPAADDPSPARTRATGTKPARSEGGVELLVQGVERVALVRLEQGQPLLTARVRPLPMPDDKGTEVEALHRAVLDLAAQAVEIAHPEAAVNLAQLASQDPMV